MQVTGGSTQAFPETGTVAEADLRSDGTASPGGGRPAFPRVVRPSDAGALAAAAILRGGPAALAGADATALLPRSGTPRTAADFRPSGEQSGTERTALLPGASASGSSPSSGAHDPHEVTVQLDSVQATGPEPADAADRPVFVDESGRRSRTFRRLGLLVAGLCAGYAAVIGITLLSGSSDAPWLPVPQKEDKPASRVDSSPVPSASAPAAPGRRGRTGTGTEPAAPDTAPVTVAAVPVPGRASPSAGATTAARPPAAASPTPGRSAPPAPGGSSPKPTPTATASTEASPAPSTTAPSPVATESPAGGGGPQPQGSAARPAAG
ncbi:hypothetical protein ACIPWL_11445 [Streptomyces sp. NPDC090023]|uniref:hypothetical protein n=1 Tax=unclassified Streptomyces TaxID=2593676 RepID=UPI0037F535D0